MPAVPANLTVPFECVDYDEGLAEDGRFRGSVTFQCAWAQRLTLAKQLFGSATQATPGGTIINVTLPAEHPAVPGAFVKSVPRITGFPEENPSYLQPTGLVQSYPVYRFARIFAEYETPLYGTTPPTGGPRVEESIEPSAEFITLPYKGFFWQDQTPLQEIEAPGFLNRKVDFLYKISGLPTLPLAVLDLMGCVNQFAITFNQLGLTAAPEKLLYAPPSLTRFIYAGNNQSAWEASFRFGYNPKTWNKFFRASTRTWEYLYDGASIYRPYEMASFAAIIAVI